jgi:hypothetical protein
VCRITVEPSTLACFGRGHGHRSSRAFARSIGDTPAMQPTDVVQALGASLLLLVLAGLLGVVLALVSGVMWLRDRRLSPLAGAAGVALPVVGGLVGASLRLGGLHTDPTTALAGAVGYRLITVLFALPAAVVLAIFAAVAGYRTPPRHGGRTALFLVLVLASAGVTLLGGHVLDDLRYPVLRSAVYAVLGVLLAVSVAGEAREGAGPEATAAAGAAFALIVASGEASARALERLFLLTVMVRVADRATYLDQAWAQVIAPAAPWHLAAVAAAVVVGLAALLPALRARRFGAAWALPWLALAPAVLFVGSPGRPAIDVLAVQAPVVPVAPAPQGP